MGQWGTYWHGVPIRFPGYFYQAWVACRLVPANKVDPDDLPPETTPDCRPVNIGGAERRLVTRASFDNYRQGCYNAIVQPVQNGVRVRGGISITVFGAHDVKELKSRYREVVILSVAVKYTKLFTQDLPTIPFKISKSF